MCLHTSDRKTCFGPAHMGNTLPTLAMVPPTLLRGPLQAPSLVGCCGGNIAGHVCGGLCVCMGPTCTHEALHWRWLGSQHWPTPTRHHVTAFEFGGTTHLANRHPHSNTGKFQGHLSARLAHASSQLTRKLAMGLLAGAPMPHNWPWHVHQLHCAASIAQGWWHPPRPGPLQAE